MREIVESLTTCAIIGVYIVVGIAVASGVVSFFGVDLRKSRVIVTSIAGAFLIAVSLSQLASTSEPVLNVILFLVFLVCFGAGIGLARLKPYRSWTGTIGATYVWSVFALLAFMMAAIVGGGYPANPLGASELVQRMRHPLLALLICILGVLLGMVLNADSLVEEK